MTREPTQSDVEPASSWHRRRNLRTPCKQKPVRNMTERSCSSGAGWPCAAYCVKEALRASWQSPLRSHKDTGLFYCTCAVRRRYRVRCEAARAGATCLTVSVRWLTDPWLHWRLSWSGQCHPKCLCSPLSLAAKTPSLWRSGRHWLIVRNQTKTILSTFPLGYHNEQKIFNRHHGRVVDCIIRLWAGGSESCADFPGSGTGGVRGR